MALRFGTDGVRGVAFEQLTEPFVEWLGRAAAETIASDTWVVGRDTRESGPRLLTAFAAGVATTGAKVVDLGVVPTPLVAHVSAVDSCGGAMVSASHNPWMDNGIKLFAPGGLKLSDEQQSRVQDRLDGYVSEPPPPAASAACVARDARDLYAEAVGATLEGRDLTGLRIVLDCANGSASTVAEAVFAGLGAEVMAIFDQPDGRNINDGCGSTHPEALRAEVVRHSADLGLAFDGDADRLIAVDSAGALVDGDRLMALFATDLRDRGRLAHDTLVVTVMSNLGLRRAMDAAGIALFETPVGDRYVLEAMDAGGFDLGGEQSGHLIFRRSATTGDGIASGVRFADVVRRADADSAQLSASAMTTYPQVLINVRVGERPDDVDGALEDDVAAIVARLGADGRVLIRPSGTEPLIRVMVEATTDELARSCAEELAKAVEERLS